MFIDSHCHLDFPELKDDMDTIIQNAKNSQIKAILNIATKPQNFDAALKLIEPYDFIYQAVGTHPHYSKDDTETSPTPLVEYINKHNRIVAVGEVGLDFHYNHSPYEQQEMQFRRHIEAARILQLPVIVHTRKAEAETLQILKEERAKGDFDILIHCFSGSEEFADTCLELGAYLSFSGILTFKSAAEIQKVAQKAPKNRILIETDAPYLAPVPYRGKTNEPAYVAHTAAFLAELRDVSIDEIAEITSDNFYQLFKKARK
ncbi:MAG: TatD family hydrolase [Alphaproteobacteria bacterium]